MLAATFTPMTDTGYILSTCTNVCVYAVLTYFFVFSELNLPVIKPYANFLKISGINNVFCEFILPSSTVHGPRYIEIEAYETASDLRTPPLNFMLSQKITRGSTICV